MDNETLKKVIDDIIKTSQLHNEIALQISSKAAADSSVDLAHFLSIRSNLVLPLIRQSMQMTFDASATIADNLVQSFDDIAKATANLKSAVKTIQRIDKVIEVGANILATASLVATFIGAPNVASAQAAVTALVGLVGSLPPADPTA